MKIGTREIGNGAPCLVVAEVGMAHDGSLVLAHAFIDAVAKAGAEAVKFQMHRPEDGGEWRVPPPPWSRDRSRTDYWRRTAFSLTEWWSLLKHAKEAGLQFLCSAFSVEAAQHLVPMVPAWKVPSGQVTNGPMLDFMAACEKPAIISAGMGTEDEVAAARLRFREVVELQSRSLYPTPLDSVGLRAHYGSVAMWRDGDRVTGTAIRGLSDHSGTIWPALAAATLGAAMVEVHVTFSRDAYGPDVASSITLDELRLLCEGIRATRLAMQPVDREALLKGPLAEARRVYMGVGA